MRRTRHLTVLVAALAGATVLTACQDATAPSPGTASSPAAAGDSPGATKAGTVGADGADANRREYLTNDGGYVVQGSRITFVYRNGMRHQVDVGSDIPSGDGTVRGSNGVLTLKNGTATYTDSRGATTVNRSGAGAVADAAGVIVVTPDGSTTCANSRGIQFVGTDGNKGAADKNGFFFTSTDGKTVSQGRKPQVNTLAGRFTVCNTGNTASVDLYSDVLFRFDSAELTPAGKAVVASTARSIRSNVQNEPVNLVGHTDSVGTMSYNERLGKRRADTVAAQLRQEIPGIDLRVRSAGETEPVAANMTADGKDNPSGRAKNRRVTISWQK